MRFLRLFSYLCLVAGWNGLSGDNYSSPVSLLPEIGDMIMIIITSVQASQSVFAQLPLGLYAAIDSKFFCVSACQ